MLQKKQEKRVRNRVVCRDRTRGSECWRGVKPVGTVTGEERQRQRLQDGDPRLPC